MKWIRGKICLFVALMVSTLSGETQNLVPNPGYETYIICPPSMATPPGPMLCPPWVALNSANWFHTCGDPLWFGIPHNIWGYQDAHSGDAYAGGYYKGGSHEWVQAQLLDTLEEGVCYKVGYWLNLSNESCGVNRTGALLTPDPVMFPLGMTPQVDWGGEFFSDTATWIFVRDFITAAGDELYITLGNFYTDGQTAYDPDCPIHPIFAYYYFDDVIVEEVQPVPFEIILDESATACDSFLIEATSTPELEGTLFVWSTGEHSPSIMVYESGVYQVTATYGCEEMEASIEVTLNNNPIPPELGPDAILCEGESMTISLDPDAGQYVWNDGSSDPEYSITTAGTYHVTLDDGCDIMSDTITVAFISPPDPITLGPDTFLCPGEEIIFQFDPALGEFLWQDNDDSPVYVVDDDGVYAVTISNDCGAVSDEIGISITQPPFFNLGPDSTILCSGEILDIEIDETIGSFLWQDGSALSYYAISIPGTYSLTVTNACGTETDEIHIQHIPAPDIDFGQIHNACEGDTLLLSTGNNFGQFTWQDGSTDSTFQITNSGTYAVSVSNICGDDTAEVGIVFHPQIIAPELGPDFSLCPGEQVTVHASSPGAIYQWNDLSTADSLIITSAGTYFVVATGYCGTHSDTVHVTLNTQPPALNLPGDFSLCSGQYFTLDPGISGVVYVWQDGTNAPQYEVTEPGTYILTVSNACGSDADTVIVMEGGLAPTVVLPPDTAICDGHAFTLIPVFSDVNIWSWSDGSSGSTYPLTGPGEISVVVHNGCGSASDTIQVAELPPVPHLELGQDTALCAGDQVILSIPFSDVSILWSDGSYEHEFVCTGPSTVSASISNACGISVDTIKIYLWPEVPMLDLGPDLTICPGVEILVEPGIDDVNFEWHDGSTSPEYLIIQEGVISLIISNPCGTSHDTLFVTESLESPQVDLGDDVIACVGETIHLEANIVGVSYLWNDGSTGNEVLVTQSGVWILEISNGCGLDRDTVEVEISGIPPAPMLGSDTMICEGLSLILVSNADEITSTLWHDGSTGPTLEASLPGPYILYQANRCGAASDTLSISVEQVPDSFYLGPDTVLCPGSSFLIFAPVTIGAIHWQDGSTGPTMTADREQTYSLIIANDCGMAEDELAVTVDSRIPLIDFHIKPLCPGDELLLNAEQPFEATYLWSTGSQLSSIEITTPGIYGVNVSTLCFDEHREVEIMQADDCGYEIYIPNVFSPDGDGINDEWIISVGEQMEVLEMQCTVYDKWGNVQFQTSAVPVSWTGTKAGETLNPAVFAYTFQITYRRDNLELTEKFSGDITLIR